MSGLSYKKWDEMVFSSASEDEKDSHPNVDPKLIRRLKREKRENEEQQEIARLKAIDDEKSRAALKKIEDRKLPKVRVSASRSVIVGVTSSASNPQVPASVPQSAAAAAPASAMGGSSVSAATSAATPAAPAVANSLEQSDEEKFVAYIKKHEATLMLYGEQTIESSKEFLMKYHEACFDPNAPGCILLKMLELEMAGKHKEMLLLCRQYLMLTNINDLAKSSKADPRAALNVFFSKIKEPETMARLAKETEEFGKNITKRAIEKKKEQEAQKEEEEEEERVLTREERLGPGGLDPVEVFPTLPLPMQEAFQKKDLELLKAAIRDMSVEDAKRHLKRCKDSGLWNSPDDDDEDKETPATQDS